MVGDFRSNFFSVENLVLESKKRYMLVLMSRLHFPVVDDHLIMMERLHFLNVKSG